MTVLLRESRFIHEAKRRDQEIGKLKERLLKVMSDAKQQHGRDREDRMLKCSNMNY